MEILIVKLAALGDVLRTTSLLGPLRRRHPDGRVTWLTSKAAAPLLEKNPLIHRVAVSGRALAGRRFDLVLSLEEDPRTARLAARSSRGELVGVTEGSKRLSYTPSSAPYYAMSLLNRDSRGGHAKADRLKAANRRTYAEIWLEILGLPKPKRPADLKPSLILEDKDRTAARGLARRHGLEPGKPIGLNPGAGARWPAKQLSVEAAAKLLDSIHGEFRRPLLLLGGKDEASRNQAILKRARAPVIDAGTRHSLRSFAGIVDLCGLIITTDSLALHVAAALGKPAVALVGPTSAAELDVFGQGRVVAPPSGCSCFYRPRCRLALSCLDRLPAEAVLSAARSWL